MLQYPEFLNTFTVDGDMFRIDAFYLYSLGASLKPLVEIKDGQKLVDIQLSLYIGESAR